VRILGLESLDSIVGISTNSSVAVLYAVERGAGIGFLPTSASRSALRSFRSTSASTITWICG